MAGLLDELCKALTDLPDQEKTEAIRLAQEQTRHMQWLPNPGPQLQAYESEADELLYGGEPGGGKTDLLLGTALNCHRRSLILRRLNNEVEGLIDRMEEILGSPKGIKRAPPASYRTRERIMMFGGCQHFDDREKYRGVPKDFIGFDELPNFLEGQYTFIIAWARTTYPGQRVRTIATANPPNTEEGLWVNRRWAAWLDPNHPNPALPGELRWYTTIDGKDTEVEGPGPVMVNGVPILDDRGKQIHPRSRTFVPAELDDNPDLAETGYEATLSGLPEELRRTMKGGDFTAGVKDDQWQVFPSAWIEAAQSRWHESGRTAPMTALGVDIAQGGEDDTVLAPKHGSWFDHLHVVPGKKTPDGPTVAGMVFTTMRNGCEVILDMGGGYGGSTRDHLKQAFSPTLYNGSDTAQGLKDRTGALKFINIRAAAHWHLREALDPDYGSHLALPPDPELKADLAAVRWAMTPSGIKMESKEEIKKRIGRSPGRGDAVVMAHFARGKTNGTRLGIGTLQTRAITSSRTNRSR